MLFINRIQLALWCRAVFSQTLLFDRLCLDRGVFFIKHNAVHCGTWGCCIWQHCPRSQPTICRQVCKVDSVKIVEISDMN